MQFLRRINRWAFRYFALVGVLLHLAPIVAVVYVIHTYQLTFPLLVEKGLDKAGIDAPWLVSLFAPAPMYANTVFDGHVRKSGPRILPFVPPGETVGEILSKRAATFKAARDKSWRRACGGKPMLFRALCWQTTGDRSAGAQALAMLKASPSIKTDNIAASDAFAAAVWTAMTYDLLRDFPGFRRSDRVLVEARMEETLERILTALDSDSPSLWHGRSTLAATAWLVAVVLEPKKGKRLSLMSRAQGHFLQTIDAIALTGAWPSGYNYWVNSRAFLITLASAAYVNGLVDAKYADKVRETMRRIAYWHIYATRPDNRAEGLGDEGPRVDLKDETRRPIDIIAQITRDPVIAAYSQYLAKLRNASYYRGYRWSYVLTHDPTVRADPNITDKSLAKLSGRLPNATVFGPGALDLAFIRSGFGPDDTFISFRAGKIMSHHQHYDAGHFTLFKGAPLAVTSGIYAGNVFSPHRKDYTIRTVAKNSLLIMRPGEQVQPNRFFWGDNVADGGQRVIMPTGSAIKSIADWRSKLDAGPHLDTARIDAFENVEGSHAYISADLTNAYNTPAYDSGGSGGKVRAVRRQLLYLRDEDLLVVHDDVTTTDPSYVKKWLLHVNAKPDIGTAKVLKGGPDNGILENEASVARITNERGHLTVQRILPAEAKVRILGGPDYQFYVERDGDDSDLDGQNMINGFRNLAWFDIGTWRIEIQPKRPRERDQFLMVLAPSIDTERAPTAIGLSGLPDGFAGVATGRAAVLFADGGKTGRVALDAPANAKRIILAGLPPGARVSATIGGHAIADIRAKNGIVVMPLGETGSRAVSFTWSSPAGVASRN